jgi:hypothetical protein
MGIRTPVTAAKVQNVQFSLGLDYWLVSVLFHEIRGVIVHSTDLTCSIDFACFDNFYHNTLE